MINVEKRENGVQIVSMSHGKANALDLEFCRELTHLFSRANSDHDARAMVLMSAGTIFSGGVDLVRLVHEPVAYTRQFYPALLELFRTLLVFSKPFVAAINGGAVAGGCVIGSAADCRVILPTARIGIPELRVGVPFPVLGLEIMRMVAAPTAFQNMINIGSTWTGQAAVEVGLADEVCDPEVIRSVAIEKAEQLLQVPSSVFQLTKRQLRKPVIDRVAAAGLDFDSEIEKIWYSEQLRAVVREYVSTRLGK